MILVSCAPVEFECRIVSVVQFQVYSIHAHFKRPFLEKFHRLPAKSSAPVGSVNIQFVDECIVAMKFKTETNGEDDISDGFVIFA